MLVYVILDHVQSDCLEKHSTVMLLPPVGSG